MRTKKVTRHYCDFCSKGMFRKPQMVQHEVSCTKNPARTCLFCSLCEYQPAELSAMVKFAKEHSEGYDDNDWSSMGEKDLAELRRMADGCPLCMLAALRQSNVYADTRFFNLKAELKSVWSDINARPEC